MARALTHVQPLGPYPLDKPRDSEYWVVITLATILLSEEAT
jgi:hypothetical protein